MIPFSYIEFALFNGLLVVLHRDATLPLICVNVTYGVGSADEENGRTGYAHLVEHLMFEGSPNLPHGEYDRRCEAVGGDNNAETTEDKTSYHLLVPSHCLELALWMESDRLCGLSLTEESLAVQRSVVMEERRQCIDNQPYGTIDERLARLLFPDHPYGHHILGSMEDIASATMESVQEFHTAWYRPGNAVLTIVGDHDPDRTADLVDKWFGSIPASYPKDRGIPVSAQKGGAREVIADAVPLPAVIAGFRLPPDWDEEFTCLEIAAEAIGGGNASLLSSILVYERRVASHLSFSCEARRAGGWIVAAAFAAPGRSAEEVEDTLREVFTDEVGAGLGAEQLEQARNRLEARAYEGMRPLVGRAERFAHHALFDSDAGLALHIPERYVRVSVSQIEEAVRRYLRFEEASILHFVPAESDGPQHSGRSAFAAGGGPVSRKTIS
ncbi:MAG: pitrilysin family protein [Bacteroidota bacterium]|nr:pitrilysin family protein [Bacteroidota bacterium]